MPPTHSRPPHIVLRRRRQIIKNRAIVPNHRPRRLGLQRHPQIQSRIIALAHLVSINYVPRFHLIHPRSLQNILCQPRKRQHPTQQNRRWPTHRIHKLTHRLRHRHRIQRIHATCQHVPRHVKPTPIKLRPQLLRITPRHRWIFAPLQQRIRSKQVALRTQSPIPREAHHPRHRPHIVRFENQSRKVCHPIRRTTDFSLHLGTGAIKGDRKGCHLTQMTATRHHPIFHHLQLPTGKRNRSAQGVIRIRKVRQKPPNRQRSKRHRASQSRLTTQARRHRHSPPTKPLHRPIIMIIRPPYGRRWIPHERCLRLQTIHRRPPHKHGFRRGKRKTPTGRRPTHRRKACHHRLRLFTQPAIAGKSDARPTRQQGIGQRHIHRRQGPTQHPRRISRSPTQSRRQPYFQLRRHQTVCIRRQTPSHPPQPHPRLHTLVIRRLIHRHRIQALKHRHPICHQPHRQFLRRIAKGVGTAHPKHRPFFLQHQAGRHPTARHRARCRFVEHLRQNRICLTRPTAKTQHSIKMQDSLQQGRHRVLRQ